MESFVEQLGAKESGNLLIASLFLPYTIKPSISKEYFQIHQQSIKKKLATKKAPLKHQPSNINFTTINSPLPSSRFPFIQSNLGNIGLQNAIHSTVNNLQKSIKVKWFGTFGVSTDDFDDNWKETASDHLAIEHSCYPVFITDGELDGHYKKFCKQVLWKPFHYQLQDLPKSKPFEETSWIHYLNVNQKFANLIVKNYTKGDIIWVNDYHLMLVPSMVREAIPSATIGFFLHIPFPSSEIFRCIHVRKQILYGMLGSDLIGFQTYSFMRHFLMTCSRILSLESTPKGIQLEDSMVKVGIFPIGINLVALNERRASTTLLHMIASLKERFNGKKVLIGRDKNDYVKGVRQKMMAFERFLNMYPEWRGKVVLVQVALSTTEVNENNSHVNEVVARINSKFGSIEYCPVVYLHQDIDFLNYLALLTIADGCIITSLRDGMNLTSHEYVVCQDGTYNPLIISEFAGTYGNFGAAIRVNPWDTGEVADAINEALTMPQEDKFLRWKEMYSYVSKTTAQKYVETFVNEIKMVHEDLLHTTSSSIPLLLPKTVHDAYSNLSGRRIFYLDHDGTIVSSSSRGLSSQIALHKVSSGTVSPSMTIRSTSRTGSYGNLISHGTPFSNTMLRDLLMLLTSDPRNIVYIVSGRKKSDLAEFMDIPNLGLSAENGGFIKYANCNEWEPMNEDLDMSWRQSVEEIFQYYTDRTPGSYIEQKDINLVWHYDSADLSYASWQAAECTNHIEQSLTSTFPIVAMKKKKSVEVSFKNLNKGLIVKRTLENHRWLGASKTSRRQSYRQLSYYSSPNNKSDSGEFFNTNHRLYGRPTRVDSLGTESNGGTSPMNVEPINFVFSVGDDRGDEYMFEYLNKIEEKLADGGILTSTSKNGGDDKVVGSVSSTISMLSTPSSCLSTPTELRNGILPCLNTPKGGEKNEFDEVSSSSVMENGNNKRMFITCTVGSKSSAAKWFLPSVGEVLVLLQYTVKEK